MAREELKRLIIKELHHSQTNLTLPSDPYVRWNVAEALGLDQASLQKIMSSCLDDISKTLPGEIDSVWQKKIDEVVEQIGSFSQKAGKERRYHSLLFVTRLILAGTVALATGWPADQSFYPWLRSIAFVASVLLALEEGFRGEFKPRQRWLLYNFTANRLRRLKADAEDRECLGLQYLQFRDEFQTILNEANSYHKEMVERVRLLPKLLRSEDQQQPPSKLPD
jgi:hypothetical protein